MWLLLPILLTLHVVVCLLLVLVVLMQLPRSEGLGAAFGSAVTENIFGAQTTHVLAKFTVWLGVAFFVVTLLLAVVYSHRDTGRTRVQQELLNSPQPSASPTGAAATPAPGAASPTPAAAGPSPAVANPTPATATSPAPVASPATTAP